MFYTAVATVDLEAIRANVRRITTLTDAAVMAAVKADAYGHGLVPVAKAALEGGATWLGVAQLCEAIALRRAGVTAPILAWLFTPDSSLLEECIVLGVDLSAPDTWAIETIAAAAKKAGQQPRIHLEVDTGMGRGGVQLPEFATVVDAARQAEATGAVDVVGVWSHLACADEPEHESVPAQYRAFEEALEMVESAGIAIDVRHIANSAATVTGLPSYDLVRTGLVCYGLSPIEASPEELGLTPALRLTAELAMVKTVAAGSGISYGHTFIAERDTRIGVVPLGYGDGIPRHASNRVTVSVAGQRVPLVGRVCMDQFMVDLGDLTVAAGAEVVLIGDSACGEPTAAEWAEAIGTINYEIVTRLGGRIPRQYVNERSTISLPTAEATIDLGQRLANFLKPGDLVVLTGGLGAGKTTLTKGIGMGLGVMGQVASPTFIIARSHDGPTPLVHVDAYRLSNLAEIDDLDLDSAVDDSVTVVEWGEGLVEELAEDRLEIEIVRPRGEDEHGRYAVITAVGPRWQSVDLLELG